MPAPPGFMRVLTWDAPGTYPTRGVTCPDGTFLGQSRQAPVPVPTLRYRWPLAGDEAACYRIAGDERVADGPADALIVEDLAWWRGVLYGAGWTLDEDSRGAPALWRRYGEDDWALIWRGEWLAAIGPADAEGVRLFATTPALFVRVHAGAAPARGLAYTGAMTDVGRLEWAGEAGGLLWVTGEDRRRFEAFGAVVMIPRSVVPAWGIAGWTWPWLRYPAREGWVWSEPHVWRGRVWLLGVRLDTAQYRADLRLAWLLPDGNPMTQAELRVVDVQMERAIPHLMSNRFGLWGLVTAVPSESYGGDFWSELLDDLWLHHDGRTARAGSCAPRALGPLGVPAWAGEREAWIARTTPTDDYPHGVHPALGASTTHTYTLLKTPLVLCIYEVGVEWGDGSGGNEPEVAAVTIEWALAPGVDWSHRPQVDAVTVAWGDGSGGNEPTVGSVEIAWSDGIGGNEPEVAAVTIEWAAEGEGPGPDPEDRNRPTLGEARVEWGDAPPPIDPGTENVLWLVEESERVCSRLRIVVQGLSAEDKAALRVYVRTDKEHLPIDAWHTYQVGALRHNVFLEEPGKVVRVGIVRPAGLARPDTMVQMVRD